MQDLKRVYIVINTWVIELSDTQKGKFWKVSFVEVYTKGSNSCIEKRCSKLYLCKYSIYADSLGNSTWLVIESSLSNSIILDWEDVSELKMKW